MGADDGVGAVFVQQILQHPLGTADFLAVFAAPVQQHDDDVGILLLCRVHDLDDPVGIQLGIVCVIVGIEQIDGPGGVFRQTQVAQTLGEGDKRQAHAVGLDHRHAAAVAPRLRRREGAHVLHPGGADRVDGGFQTRHAVGDGGAVGCLQQIKALSGEGAGQNGGGAGGGRAIGRAGKIAHQVPHGQVGAAELLCRAEEAGGEIISVALAGVGEQMVADKNAARGGNGDGGILLLRCADHRGLLRCDGTLVQQSRENGAAIVQDQDDRADQQSDGQHGNQYGDPPPTLAQPALLLHLFQTVFF